MMDTATAARVVGGRVVGANVTFSRVTTDTRALARGDLFVALKGERFDGHDFVATALQRGAAAALVAADRAAALTGDLVAVPDTLAALGTLAAHWRARFSLPLAVVVGSNGKTTVKEMIAAIFRAHAGASGVLATPGNLNNAIGLPLTLLGLDASHRLAVVEIGMNHRGETRELAAIARPTITVVNNAQREHQEFMTSVAEVAAEHADAVRALPRGGVAVINADDVYAAGWRAAALEAGATVLSFAQDVRADVTGRGTLAIDGSDVEIATPAGSARVRLAVPGRHMVHNALAAATAALAAGVPLAAIVDGLEQFRPVAGRLAARAATSGAAVIDDTYNANPDSVRAAIDVLARADGRRWLVLGDMGEVGALGPSVHREIGEYARRAGIERLYATGELARAAVVAFGERAQHVPDVAALAATVAADARAGVTILVKGSRFMRMERVVVALTGDGVTPRGGPSDGGGTH